MLFCKYYALIQLFENSDNLYMDLYIYIYIYIVTWMCKQNSKNKSNEVNMN